MVQEPDGGAKPVTSEPVERVDQLHSMAGDAHQNGESRRLAFSDGSRPTQVDFASSTGQHQPAKLGDPSDTSFI